LQKLKIKDDGDINGVLRVRPRASYRQICGRLTAEGGIRLTTRSGKPRISGDKKIRDISALKRRLIKALHGLHAADRH